MKEKMDKEYSDAFNGTKPDESGEGGTGMAEEAAAPAVMIAVDPVVNEEQTPAEAMEAGTESAVAAEETPAVMAEGETDLQGGEGGMAGEPTGESEMSPEDVQREKSWEGRLRKREEELAAREAEMGKPGESMAAGEALAKLSDQFGPEFADLIVQVIKEQSSGHEGSEDIAALREEVGSVISDLKFAQHKRDILAAKSDAYDIGETPEFKEWCASQDDAEECARIVANGTAVEVINLLTRYEEYLNKDADTGGGEEEDAATAVRGSSPITLPNRPVAGDEDEYQAAWKAL